MLEPIFIRFYTSPRPEHQDAFFTLKATLTSFPEQRFYALHIPLFPTLRFRHLILRWDLTLGGVLSRSSLVNQIGGKCL